MEKMTSLVTSLLLAAVMTSDVAIAATKTLYIGGLIDLSNKDGYGALPAARLAIEEVNNNPSILPGYKLELLDNSTEGGLGLGQSVFQSYLNHPPKKIMLLGPIDDTHAKATASYAALPQFRLLQFSYGTTDLELAEKRTTYPYFFRTLISMASFDAPRIALVKKYGWKEVGIVYGNSINHLNVANQLKTRLQAEGISVLTEVRLQANDPGRPIRTMKEKNVHVVLGLFDLGQPARKMFCQALFCSWDCWVKSRKELAYKNGMYGPHYVWILQLGSNSGWWKPSSTEDIGGCSDIEMTCQIQNHFYLKPTTLKSSDGTFFSHSGKNTTTILKGYYSRVDNYTDTTNRSELAMYAYAAVWAMAHVLENSRLQLNSWGKPLENVTYGDKQAADLFFNETLKLKFKSPNLGNVRFYKNGNRRFDMSINQLIIKDGKATEVQAAVYNVDTKVYIPTAYVSWLAGTPYKKLIEYYSTRHIHRALFGALVFLAALGILYALVCYFVVLIHMKDPFIWNSSPIINIIIILGCILNYITIILFGFDYTLVTPTTVSSLCKARAWTFAIGFTLSVGGLVAKLWIAYCVLSERFVRRRKNMLICMLCIVLVLLIVDFIIMGCWEGLNPLYRQLVTYRTQEQYKCYQPITDKTFEADIVTVEHCKSGNLLMWLLIVLIYKFLVVLFGVFLAWQCRKLYIKSLNDTQYCVVCMFVVLVFIILGLLLSFLVISYPNLFFGLIGTCVFLCTTILLALLFLHKMVRVSCRRKRRGTLIVVGGGDTESDSTCCTCCSKVCSYCACSTACCIMCWSCFPCCNAYLCCRACCCGSKVQPSKNVDDKTEFYINGQPQDKEGQIAYLLREIHKRDEELCRLRSMRVTVTNWTQTNDDEMDEDTTYEEGDSSSNEGSSGSTGGPGGRRGRRGSRFKMFNQGADYSHVKSKVDTGARKTSTMSRSPGTQRKHDEKYYLGVWRARGGSLSEDDIAKLKAELEEKDKEITRLKKEAGRKTSVAVHQRNSKPTLNDNTKKVTVVHEECPETEDKQCQTGESPTSSPGYNRVILLNKAHVDKKDDVIIVTQPTSNGPSPAQSPRRGSNTNPTRERRGSKLTSKDSKISSVVISGENEKEKEKKEEATSNSPDEYLFGKPEEQNSQNNFNKDAGRSGLVIVQYPDKNDVREKEEQQLKVEEKRKEEEKNEREKVEKEKDERRKENERIEKEEEEREEEKRKEEQRKKEEEERKKEKEQREEEEEQRKEQERKKEEERIKEEEKQKERESQKEEKRKKKFSWTFGKKDKTDSPTEDDNKDKEKPNESPKDAMSPEGNLKPKSQNGELPKEDENGTSPLVLELSSPENNSPTTQEDKKLENPSGETDDKPDKVDGIPVKKDEKPGTEDEKPDKEDEKPSDGNNDRNSEDDSKDDDDDDDGVDRIDEEDENEDENEEDDGEDEDGDDDKGEESDGEGGRRPKKPRKRRKPIGGKLNWNAESKVDTGGGYKRRPSKKIKTYKTDYSNVRSKLYSSAPAKKSEDNDDNKEEPKKRKAQRVVRNKRWRPDYSNAKTRGESTTRRNSQAGNTS